jgi:hypothetical protein
MNWDISVGRYALRLIERVSITRSVEELSDTAQIVLPATVFNRALEIEDKIHAGDEVTVRLGYDSDLKTEFEGYLKTVSTDGGNLTLECEDALYNYRCPMDDMEITGASVRTLLEKCNAAVLKATGKKYSLSCDYAFTYDKFTIRNNTAFDVLKTVQEESGPNVYLKGNTLHVHPQYVEIFGEAAYDFARNIEGDGTNLRYRKKEDRKLLVTVEGAGSKGKVVRVQAGTPGGDRMTLKLPGVSSTASLKARAEEILKNKVYDGYEGTITGWLLPFCDAGYRATIVDREYEYKNGGYYVISVKTDFSRDGGSRVVELGKLIEKK